MFEGPVPLYLFLILLFLLLSAFFSGSEAALLSLQRVRLQGLLQRQVPGARRVARMVEHPERFLPAILLGNNLANTAAAALGTAVVLTWITADGKAIVVATAAVTVLLLVVGEMIPKTLGARHAEQTSLLVVPPLEIVHRLLFPLVFLLHLLSRGTSRLFGGGGWHQSVTEEELKIMKQVTGTHSETVDNVLSGEDILRLQNVVRRVPAADHVFQYARDLSRATRPHDKLAPEFTKELIQWGAGPRASISLMMAAKARAVLHGRFHTTTEDVREMAAPVLRHRILPTFNAEAAGINSDRIIDRLLDEVSPQADDILKD